MGLVTAFSYGCLTDPDVYDSGVDWRNYPPTDPGNYVVKGAPNYVVTSLEHTNDSATNSLAFEVNMAKTYRQVLVNSQGRGWLGFESITTHNIVDDIWTTEHYFQTFPKIGLKSKVDTLNSDPKVEKGRGVNSIQLLAYDMASGELLAKRETSGRLTCTRVDGFGRNIEARMQSKVTRTLSTTAKEFLPKVYAASSDFMKLLSDKCILDPVQQYSYDLFKSSAGNSYLTSSTLSYFNDTDIGQLQVLDVVDCVGQKRIQRSRQGVDPASSSTDKHVTWKCWTYDTRGNPLFESFNLQSAPWDNFEYQPGPSEGTTSVFDKLGRVLNKTRPSHNDSAINSVSSLQYSIGGGTVLETVTGPDPKASATNAVFWSAPRTYISINGKEHIISAANQGALTSEFTYDVAGNLLSASDPQAKRERRKYNSLGQLRILDNVYQRMQDPAKPPEQLAMTYIYNGTGQLEKTINANEEAIMFDRDSKGRPISKTGFDGRVLRYQYDDAGKERLSSMTVYPSGEAKQLETKLSFEYDERARLSSRALTLADGVEYEIVFEYDWQGQVMTKSYPNGATKLNKYIGSLLSYSEVYAEGPGGQRETWLDGTFEYNNATEKPNKITFGKADGQTDFQHTFEYDLQSYTLSHNLDQLGQSPSDTKPLVQKTYIYNGADQLAQNLDGMSNVAKKYNYEGKRLKNSQIGDANVKNYVYDSSGNILTKADTTISYGSNPATGKRGAATAFNI
ncbi:hypothetical protein NW765_008164 [Fusarium oxysporum]|nr:hypothetical protein NW765_008164 [Fusarium oxysporum]